MDKQHVPTKSVRLMAALIAKDGGIREYQPAPLPDTLLSEYHTQQKRSMTKQVIKKKPFRKQYTNNRRLITAAISRSVMYVSGALEKLQHIDGTIRTRVLY